MPLRQLSLELQEFVVVSGGSGANAIVGAFSSARQTHALPLSDDGGSSSEIQRVIGGPSIGDIRSRLTRLIDPSAPPSSPLFAIRRLLEYRLSATRTSEQVKSEWHSIVEGRHLLWKGIPNDRKECIRAFLVHCEAAILKKAQRGFNWKRASIGNLFLSGAFLFLGSLPSAIFLFASLTEISHERMSVLPVINTTATATIAAELENGDIVVGQSEISHPSVSSETLRSQTPSLRAPTPLPSLLPLSSATSRLPSRVPTPSLFEGPILGDEDPPHSDYEDWDDDGAASKETSRTDNGNVLFSKDPGESRLAARISRIFYLNAYGSEIFPRANPLFLESLSTATSLVYSCGSLYTSIIPCLALRGIGNAIATSPTLSTKILLLNGTLDRETPGYTALDFVEAVRGALSYGYGEVGEERPAKDFVTHLVYLEEGEVEMNLEALELLGIECIRVKGSGTLFDEEAVLSAFRHIFAPSTNDVDSRAGTPNALESL